MKKSIVRFVLISLLLFAFLISLVSAAGTNFDDAYSVSSDGNFNIDTPYQPTYFKIDVGAFTRLGIIPKKLSESTRDNLVIEIYDSDRILLAKDDDSFEGTIYSWINTGEKSFSGYIKVYEQYESSSNQYLLSINFTFEEDNKDSPLANTGENFDSALKIEQGNYPDCCRVYKERDLTNAYITNTANFYKIDVKKNDKLIVRVTPKQEKEFNIQIYDTDRKSVKEEFAPNEGAIVTAEYVSLKNQEVYFKIWGWSNYGMDISVERASSDEIKAVSPSTSSSSSSYKSSLDSSDYSSSSALSGVGIIGTILGIGMMFLLILLIPLILIYVYLSLAFTAIAKKNNQSIPGLAWIPFAGPAIIAYKSSGMHWWPWLFLIALIFPFISFWLIFVAILPLLGFAGFVIVWHWKLYEAIGKPKWWALMPLIPGVGGIIYLICVGIAAWSKD